MAGLSETPGSLKPGTAGKFVDRPDFTGVPESIDKELPHVMAGPPDTPGLVNVGDTKESADAPVTIEVPGSTDAAITLHTVGPSEKQRSIKPGDTEKFLEAQITTKTPKQAEKKITQGAPGPPETPRSIKPRDTETFVDLESREEPLTVDMVRPTETQGLVNVGDAEDSEDPPVTKEVPRSTDAAITRDMVGLPETPESLRPGNAGKFGDPVDSTEVPESMNKAITQDTVGPLEKQGFIKSEDTEKSLEAQVGTKIPQSTDKAITHGVPGPPEIPGTIESGDTEESERPKVGTEIPQSTDGSVTHGVPGPPETPGTIESGDTEESERPQVGKKIPQSTDGSVTQTAETSGPLISSSCGWWEVWPLSWLASSFVNCFIASPSQEDKHGNVGDGNIDTTENKDDAKEADADSEYEQISESEADDYPDAKTEKAFKEKISQIREIIELNSKNNWVFNTPHKVGIFSRSSETDYEWLIKQLKSDPLVTDVQHHYISNYGMLKFMEAVAQCTFGILYHTKNRGRINIIGVTDSLYDEELEYMSERLGKDNVIVVVDDLTDTSDEEKQRILDNQHSIRRLAKDIILFSSDEKTKETQNYD